MLQNAYFLAKIGADTAENEQHFAVFGRAVVRGRLPPSGTGGVEHAVEDLGARRRRTDRPRGPPLPLAISN